MLKPQLNLKNRLVADVVIIVPVVLIVLVHDAVQTVNVIPATAVQQLNLALEGKFNSVYH